MTIDTIPSAHFVGSMPLGSGEETFRKISSSVGKYLKRLPDGETGARRTWVGYVGSMLASHPDFEIDPDAPKFQMKVVSGRLYREFVRLRFRKGVDVSKVRFDTRYADIAIESFKCFDELQRAGVVPGGVRFQVCLPTPLAIAYNYISVSSRPDFIQAYGDHILGEVSKLSQSLPTERLAVQWDVLQEILMFENFFGEQDTNYKEEIFSVLARMGNSVPEPIELGYHFCYGSPLDEHLVLPKDTRTIVTLVEAIAASVRRPIQFLHIPVPLGHGTDEYYRPLSRLKLESTDLYLGLIHENDHKGNVVRLARAQAHCQVSGVATECGLGRAPPARVEPILAAYRQLLESMDRPH
jgi:hypothetical protein